MSELTHMDRRQTFYEVRGIINSDGTLDKDEGREGIFETIEEALECANDTIRDDHIQCVVYECRPIYLVEFGRTKVTRLGKN